MLGTASLQDIAQFATKSHNTWSLRILLTLH